MIVKIKIIVIQKKNWLVNNNEADDIRHTCKTKSSHIVFTLVQSQINNEI